MSKSEKITRVIAVTAVLISVVAFVRRSEEIKILNETYDIIHKHVINAHFAEIVRHYNEDKDI